MREQILKTITLIRESHPQMVNIYTEGSCLNFHLVLKSIWPDAEPFIYLWDHIITKIGNHFYDITGEVNDYHKYRPYLETENSTGYKDMLKSFYPLTTY